MELLSNLNFTKLNLDFFADRNDILIKNIVGDLEDLKISNGDIKLNLENGIKLNSNFNSLFNLDERLAKKYHKLFSKYKFTKNIKNLKANLNNTVSIDFDKTYKIKDYNYIISGVVEHGKFESSKPIKNNLISQEIKEIYFSDFKISTIFRPEKNNFKGNGKYSLNNQDFLSLNLENNYSNNINYLKLDCDFSNNLNLDFINYKKDNNKISSLSLDLEKKEKKIKINQLEYNNDKDSIKVNGLVFEENKFLALKKMEISTAKNDFSIQMSRNIIIKGNKFDATNLAKFFNNKNNSDKNRFKTINKKIEIDFKNIQVPLSEKLQNFKLLGVIKKGRFVKISSKGDFGGGNFIDITLKKDKNSEVKYLEIYSDLTRPLLTEYSFFQGLTGGKLLFTSIIDNTKSNSKLKIENFKLINAPGVIKLLSLADLSGLADLAEGEGLSFDLLEIDMETNKGFLKLNEILALGPSISVIMEGYQEKNGLTSLRGTLVPAKTLNKMISKIPIIGKIVIPKEVGEGLFGISFKMKGPKGDIKTSINPIKTLTPRFIQKIIEKGKESK